MYTKCIGRRVDEAHRFGTRTGASLLAVIALALVVSGCASAAPEDCPSLLRTDLSLVDSGNDGLPFQYPLDVVEDHPHDAEFCEHSRSPGGMFHAAEDFWRPAGTEVYAMADGEVSFSGTMGGYGWLVIVDHTEMNLYSLYGHLSPSRWRVDQGPVAKGDLLGYLGDEWENGGSRDEPLVAHLHLGVRAGQRTDYPGKGEWRWMAGWIRPCPAELGWLQPSAVIAGQNTPPEGFEGPTAGLFEKWGADAVPIGIILLAAVWWMIVANRKHKPFVLVAVAAALSCLGWYSKTRGYVLIAPIYAAATISLLLSIVMFVRRRSRNPHPTP